MATEKHLTIKELNDMLPEATRAKFEVVNLEGRTTGRLMSATHGEVDFNTLSIHRATQLVKNKFPYLIDRSRNDTTVEAVKGKADTTTK